MKRVLIDISDKQDLVPFIKGLVENGFEIISTGGAERISDKAGTEAIGIEDVTHFPEVLDGRVKALNPYIHGGLLARRGLPKHMMALKRLNIMPVDSARVDLYPFEETIEEPGVELADAVENIDIGDPNMVRPAAKSCHDVTVVVNQADYDEILAQIREDSEAPLAIRTHLVAKVFRHAAAYDSLIS